MSESMIPAIYSPEKGMVGCVLLQAAVGGSQAVSHLFETKDWLLAPDDTMVRMQATREQWKFIAGMSREERIQRWKDNR